ncbi:hypothetical protein [Streptomyces sp. ODS28]|uniref:hypothetical protein n=1 Tax=Streptomyces sp. ODS28 TaxID=3136688 RepID=UPI0031ECD0F6
MSLTQQYALDVHRAAERGTPPPPAPGTYEARLLRAWWQSLRFRRRLNRDSVRRGHRVNCKPLPRG